MNWKSISLFLQMSDFAKLELRTSYITSIEFFQTFPGPMIVAYNKFSKFQLNIHQDGEFNPSEPGSPNKLNHRLCSQGYPGAAL